MRLRLKVACSTFFRHALGCSLLLAASAGTVYGPSGNQLTHAPEIDLGTISSGIALLVGGVLLAGDWLGAKRRPRLP